MSAVGSERSWKRAQLEASAAGSERSWKRAQLEASAAGSECSWKRAQLETEEAVHATESAIHRRKPEFNPMNTHNTELLHSRLQLNEHIV